MGYLDSGAASTWVDVEGEQSFLPEVSNDRFEVARGQTE